MAARRGFDQASIYEPRGEGYQILVMRTWPRGVRKARIDRWLKDAGPSKALLDRYRAGGLGFAAFSREYRAELRARPEVLAELERLRQEHGRVTLLCWEREPAPCHRHVLLEYLTSR